MSSSRRLAILFVTTGFVLLGSFIVLFLIGAVSMREYLVMQTHQGISEQLSASLSWLREAEFAERSYLITLDATDSAAYDNAITQLHRQLASLSGRNQRQIDPRQVKILQQLVDGEVAELRKTIDLRNGSGFDSALTRVKTGEDSRKREAIKTQVAGMLNHEQQELRAAREASNLSFRVRSLMFLALFFLNMGVLVWSYRRLKRERGARQDALDEVRAAKHDLEEAGRAKDHFLASLSHELRTPLTPVLTMLSAWQGEAQVPKSLHGDVQLMRRNVELEARLIDDLLDLTRIAKGKLSLNCEVTDLHELIGAAIRVCEGDIKEKALLVSLKLAANRHHANVDPGRLQQVLWNILKNATKFTTEGGTIIIATKNPKPDTVEVSIRDSGIGMSAATLARVFDPFEQGEGEVLRRFGGLGLGMAISKAMMESHGGQIKAHSDGAGKGSMFTISMPTVDAPVIAEASAPVTPVSAARRGLRILLVEDHADTADVLKRVLRSRGHEVHVCDSIASATSAAESNDLDLLLSDLGLPDGTGLDLIRRLRRQHQFPAIALTGYGMDEDVARCKDAGFDGHLTKPISFEKLDAMIGKFTS